MIWRHIARSSSVNKIKLFILSALFFTFANTALAQPLSIKSKQSSISLTGELVEFDEEFLILKSDQGRITIRRSDISCTGAGCPDVADRTQQVSFLENDLMSKNQFISLLKNYANQQDITLTYEKARHTTAVNIWGDYEHPIAKINFSKGPNPITVSVGTQGTPLKLGTVHLLSRVKASAPINSETLLKIWTGQINDWAQLGGPDQAIELILPIFKTPIIASLDTINNAFTTDSLHPDVSYFLDSSAVQQKINNTPNSLGLVFGFQSINTVSITCQDENTSNLLTFPIVINSSADSFSLAFIKSITNEYEHPNRTIDITFDDTKTISELSKFQLQLLKRNIKSDDAAIKMLLHPSSTITGSQIKTLTSYLSTLSKTINTQVIDIPIQSKKTGCRPENSIRLTLQNP